MMYKLSHLRGEYVNNWQKFGKDRGDKQQQIDEHCTDDECRICLYFASDRRCSRPVDLSATTSLTLEPQLAVLIRLHCLKSTFSVSTVSPFLTNCTVVVAVHLHAVLKNTQMVHSNPAEGCANLSNMLLSTPIWS